MTYAQSQAFLFALKNHGSKFGIDRMRLLADALGNPQNAFPAIHVAGTNGKGSTSAMLEAIYRTAGKRTGLYTSPHLIRLGERVQVNRQPISENEICAYAEKIAATAARFGNAGDDDYPSFFEFMTAMALLEFEKQNVDIAVIETGLGGRLDATNILAPRLSVITSIGLDHTDYLGENLEKIAAEKGGIIKPNTPVALGPMPPEAEKTLRQIAREKNAPVFSVRERFAGDTEDFPATNLAGAHQRANAALALLATEILRTEFPVADADARVALRNIDWAARWQNFPSAQNRRLIVDVAHNAEGAIAIDALLENLRRETGKRPILVTGILGIDRARPLLSVFAKHAESLVFVQPEQDRACDFAALESCVPADFSGNVTHSTVATIFPNPGECALGNAGDIIVVAGSVYLAGEVLSKFLPGNHAPENQLQDRLPAAR